MKRQIKFFLMTFVVWWCIGFAAEPKLDTLTYTFRVFGFSLLFYGYCYAMSLLKEKARF